MLTFQDIIEELKNIPEIGNPTYANENGRFLWFDSRFGKPRSRKYDCLHFEILEGEAHEKMGLYEKDVIYIELHFESLLQNEQSDRRIRFFESKFGDVDGRYKFIPEWKMYNNRPGFSLRYLASDVNKGGIRLEDFSTAKDLCDKLSACLVGFVHEMNPLIDKFENEFQKKEATMKELKKIVDIIKNKKQIILTGAPGTGKTFATAELAVSVLGISDVDFNDHHAVMGKYEQLVADGRIFFTTFHQSMDYEDFVEGIKPQLQEGHVCYQVEDGIFKKACQAVNGAVDDIESCIDKYLEKINGWENRREIPTVSGRSKLYVWWNKGNDTISTRSVFSKVGEGDLKNSPSPLNIEKVKLQAIGEGVENNWRQYAQAFINAVKKEFGLDAPQKAEPVVLIIDEINRGNVSKIFGELITLLESDKRKGADHPIEAILPYTKEPFSVPKELYIIGTMNTTDRSTGSLDYAIRRRFAFVTLKSDVKVIEKHYDDEGLKVKAVGVFKAVEKFIIDHNASDMDIDDLMVGHSYFMARDEETLRSKIQYEVIPLVKEYTKDGLLNVAKDDVEKSVEQWLKLESVHDTDIAMES